METQRSEKTCPRVQGCKWQSHDLNSDRFLLRGPWSLVPASSNLLFQRSSNTQVFLVAGLRSQEGREFPGGPVVRTQFFHCQGPGSIPGQGTKISQATGHSQKGGEKKRELHVLWGRPPFPGLLPYCQQPRGAQALGPFLASIWPEEKVKGIFQNSLCSWQEPSFSFNAHSFSQLLLWGQQDQSRCVIAVYTSPHTEPRFPGHPSSLWPSSPYSSACPLPRAYCTLLPVSWNPFVITLGPVVSYKQNLLYPQPSSWNILFTFSLLQTGSHLRAWFSL